MVVVFSVLPNRWTAQTRTLMVRPVHAMILVNLRSLTKTTWRHGLNTMLSCSMSNLSVQATSSLMSLQLLAPFPMCLWPWSTKHSAKWKALDRGNYRGLKLTYQVMKLLERVPHSYILEMMTIDEMQWASRSHGDEEWAVRVFHGMYSNVWSYVRLNCQYIEEFGAGVGVNQCSVLSPLLCILVLEALSHKFHTDVPWELLYTGDPVFIADTQQECISKLKAWKVGMESEGLCVNMKKTKFLFSGNGHDVLKKSVLSAAMVSSTTPSNAHRVCRGSTRSTVASLSDWRPTQTMSAPGVRASLGLLMAELWLRWISTAPCLMWKPLSATEVICYAPVGAVTVPLLPDVVWPGESSGNSCLS